MNPLRTDVLIVDGQVAAEIHRTLTAGHIVRTTVPPRPAAVIAFADPHKQCRGCHRWVTSTYDLPNQIPINLPCGHAAGYNDLCPSWGPVDGCQCTAHLGAVDHPTPPHAHQEPARA